MSRISIDNCGVEISAPHDQIYLPFNEVLTDSEVELLSKRIRDCVSDDPLRFARNLRREAARLKLNSQRLGRAFADAMPPMQDEVQLELNTVRGGPLHKVNRGRPRGGVRRCPGWRFQKMASWLYSPRTFERLFQQAVRDLQEEYFEALAEKRQYKACWVRFRGYWSFWSAVALHSFVSLGNKAAQLWRLIH